MQKDSSSISKTNESEIQKLKQKLFNLITSNVPNQENIILEDISLSLASEGMNNPVFLVTVGQGNLPNLVFKKKAEDKPFRHVLNKFYPQVLQHIKEVGYGAKVYYEDTEWCIEEYKVGGVLSVEETRDDLVGFRNMQEIANFSSILTSKPIKLNTKNFYQEWIENGLEEMIKDKMAKLQTNSYISEELYEAISSALNHTLYNDETRRIVSELNRESCPFIFNHHDNNVFNVIYDRETTDMTLIDFEYSCYGPLGYDVAYLLMTTSEIFQEGAVFFEPSLWWSEDRLRTMVVHFLKNIKLPEVIPPNAHEDERIVNQTIETIHKCCLLINCFWAAWTVFVVDDESIPFDFQTSAKAVVDSSQFLMKNYFRK